MTQADDIRSGERQGPYPPPPPPYPARRQKGHEIICARTTDQVLEGHGRRVRRRGGLRAAWAWEYCVGMWAMGSPR